jgi:hypothetical protein
MLSLPTEFLRGQGRALSGEHWLSAITQGIHAARTPSDEVHALVAPLPARDQWFVLGGWSYFHQVAPSQQEMIDALPPEWRVTRQRVAQIVGKHEDRLAETGLHPPLLNAEVAVLQQAGGTLPIRTWLTHLHASNIEATPGTIRVLPDLHRLGLTPPVSYNPVSRLWSARAPHADANAGEAAWASELKRVGRAALRLQGAIARDDIAPLAVYGIEHALEVILGSGEDWDEIENYYVPRRQGGSRLIRLAQKMLSVSRPLPLPVVARGIARPAQQPTRLPVDVVRAVLAGHAGFQIRGNRVRPRRPLQRDHTLTRLESAFVDLIESRGGTITAGGVREWLEKRGVTIGFTGHLCRAPFVRRLERGLYALAGRPLPYAIRGRRERTVDEHPLIGSPSWVDDETCVVRYVSRAVLRTGGLWLPAELAFTAALGYAQWQCTFEDQQSVPLHLVARQLVGLGQLLRPLAREIGPEIHATFDLAASHVHLERPSLDSRGT